MRIATVFSGIGAPEYCLKEYFSSLNPEIVFACDCGETKPLDDSEVLRIQKIFESKKRQKAAAGAYAKKRNRNSIKDVYFANYGNIGITDDNWHDDIRFIKGTDYENCVDLFVGGSPCQSFSNMGKRLGLDDTRGTLFYDYARLVKEIKPRVFVYENVPGMLTRDKGRAWETIKDVFRGLGYMFFYSVLNSSDFGMPQNRRRLFVIGFRNEKFGKKFAFPKPMPLKTKAFDYYEKSIAPKYFLKSKGFHFVVTHPSRAKVNSEVLRTEKRNQQFNWNGDFVFVPIGQITEKTILSDAYIGEWNGKRGAIRKLTPRECFRFMGFGDDFKLGAYDVDSYKQAGNSMVVNVLRALFESVIQTGVFKK